MMKRLFYLLLCILGMTSCLGTHYFMPEIVQTSDTDDKISHMGEVCWFEVEYQQVKTRFQPGEAHKPFKYVIEIEGLESEEPVAVYSDNDLAALTEELEGRYPEFYEEWYDQNGGFPKYSKAVIAFSVPANETQVERTVEVKVSISEWYYSTDEWSEWETVFSAVQEAGRLGT